MNKAVSRKIIIVEDKHIAGIDIRRQLLGLGYEVLATAASGEMAVSQVEELHPDLVLMCIGRSGLIDSVKMANVIRGRFNTPVIYLGESTDSNVLQHAGIIDPFEYVLKPCEERNLHMTLEVALHKYDLRQRFSQVEQISQDFNDILNNILGFVHQIRRYSQDQAKVGKYADTIEKFASRGAELSFQLQSIVRKEDGGLVVEEIRNNQSSELNAEDAGANNVILFVDDEVAMQELGKEVLESEGYKVLVAGDGQQAVDTYRERWKEINLVVLDLVMPKLDGGQAFLEMKKINPAVKAFFCTGYSSDDVISSLLAEEQLRALQKPFRPPEFLKTVREVILQ